MFKGGIMRIPKGLLLALIIIFIAVFVVVGFSKEDKKESTPQEKTTVDQKPREKDLKPQEEKKPEKKKSIPSEEAQQRYDYDVTELLRESQRNVDRSINILSLVAAFTCGLIALFAVAITIAGLTGFLSYRRWVGIRKSIEKNAQYINEIRIRAEKEFDDMRKEFEKKGIPILGEEISKEFKERLDEFSRKLEFFELLGLSLEPEDYMKRGHDFYLKEDYEYALKAFNNAIELEPKNAKAWLSKGVVLRRLERFEEALEDYEKAIEIRPDWALAWSNKCGSLIRLGNLEEALKVCEKAISLKDDFDGPWYNKACLYALKKDKKNALLSLSKAINLDSTNKEEAKKDEDFKELWDDKEFIKITS